MPLQTVGGRALADLFLAWPDPVQPYPRTKLVGRRSHLTENSDQIGKSSGHQRDWATMCRDRLEILAARWPRLHARHA